MADTDPNHVSPAFKAWWKVKEEYGDENDYITWGDVYYADLVMAQRLQEPTSQLLLFKGMRAWVIVLKGAIGSLSRVVHLARQQLLLMGGVDSNSDVRGADEHMGGSITGDEIFHLTDGMNGLACDGLSIGIGGSGNDNEEVPRHVCPQSPPLQTSPPISFWPFYHWWTSMQRIR